MNRDELDKANLAAAIAIGSTLTGLLLVRAHSLSFTHDESLTYLHGVRPGLARILAFSYVDANNHPLNTLLTWLSSLAFGNAELALRLPNVAAFVLFFAAVFLLLRRRVRPALVVPGLLLLTCNPFQLDFFALCRGYGLGLGFMAASLCFASKSLEPADGGGAGSRRRRRNAQRAGWFALGATLANLTLLNYYLALLVVLGMLQFTRERKAWLADASAAGGSPERGGFFRAFLRDWAAPQLRQALLLAAVLTPVVVKLRMKDSFYLGGDTGFWRDTVGSLVEGTLYSQPYSEAGRCPLEIGVAVVLAAAAAVLAWRLQERRRRSNAEVRPAGAGIAGGVFLERGNTTPVARHPVSHGPHGVVPGSAVRADGRVLMRRPGRTHEIQVGRNPGRGRVGTGRGDPHRRLRQHHPHPFLGLRRGHQTHDGGSARIRREPAIAAAQTAPGLGMDLPTHRQLLSG